MGEEGKVESVISQAKFELVSPRHSSWPCAQTTRPHLMASCHDCTLKSFADEPK